MDDVYGNSIQNAGINNLSERCAECCSVPFLVHKRKVVEISSSSTKITSSSSTTITSPSFSDAVAVVAGFPLTFLLPNGSWSLSHADRLRF